MALMSISTPSCPRASFPQQDTGRLFGSSRRDQGISFQAMRQKLTVFVDIVAEDPAVESHRDSPAAAQLQRRRWPMFVTLKPLKRAEDLRRRGDCPPAPKLAQGTGRQPVPAAGAGPSHRRTRRATRNINTRCSRRPGRTARCWAPASRRRCAHCRNWSDVNTDQQDTGAADLAGHRPRQRLAARASPRS